MRSMAVGKHHTTAGLPDMAVTRQVGWQYTNTL